MKHLRRSLFLVLLAASWAGLTAEEIHEPLPPQPLRQPLVPQASSSQQGDTRQTLLEQLAARVRDNEQAARQLLRQYDGEAPPIIISDHEELVAAAAARNEAWRLLTTALQQRQQAIVPRRPDQLDRPGALVNDSELRRLQAENELAVARCLQEMVQVNGPDQALLQQGRKVVDQLLLSDLGEAERVIAYFLRVWFTVELARIAEDDQRRAVLVAEAQDRYRNFLLNYPDSPLVANAEWLITMLDFDPAALDNDGSTAAANPVGAQP